MREHLKQLVYLPADPDNTHRKDTPQLYLMLRIIATKNEIVNKVLCFFREMSFFLREKNILIFIAESEALRCA